MKRSAVPSARSLAGDLEVQTNTEVVSPAGWGTRSTETTETRWIRPAAARTIDDTALWARAYGGSV